MLRLLLLLISPFGRIGRAQFLITVCTLLLLSFGAYYGSVVFDSVQVASGVNMSSINHLSDISGAILTLIGFNIYCIWVLIIKRLHDIDNSGWWSTLFVLCIAAPFILNQFSILEGPAFLYKLSILQIFPFLVCIILLVFMMAQAGTPTRNHYGLPYHLLPKKKRSKARINPFKPHETVEGNAVASPSSSATIATPLEVASLRVEEMRTTYKAVKQQKLNELQEKMRIAPVKKETNSLAT